LTKNKYKNCTFLIRTFFLVLLVLLFSEANVFVSWEFGWWVWRIRDGLHGFATAFGGTPLLEILQLFNSNGLKGSESCSEILFLDKKIVPPNI